MSAGFLVSALLMSLVAMGIAAAPLVRRATVDDGIVNAPLIVVASATLVAIALYTVIGRPDIASGAAAAEPLRPAADAAPRLEKRKAASVGALLAGLEQHLQEDPDDAKGWLLLAKSYDHVGRRQDAVAAYDKAAALGLADGARDTQSR